MVAAPLSYIGLAIALLLIGGVCGSVWVLINKMVRGPEKQITSQRALPAAEEESDDENDEKTVEDVSRSDNKS